MQVTIIPCWLAEEWNVPRNILGRHDGQDVGLQEVLVLVKRHAVHNASHQCDAQSLQDMLVRVNSAQAFKAALVDLEGKYLHH